MSDVLHGLLSDVAFLVVQPQVVAGSFLDHLAEYLVIVFCVPTGYQYVVHDGSSPLDVL